MQLSGINAIITGANQGLGLEIATQYVKAGANVALCARERSKLDEAVANLQKLAAPTQKIVASACDVSNAAAVDAFVKQAIQELGSVQVLVNNAGVYGPKGPSESVDWTEWVRTFEINVFGVMLCARAIIPHLKQQGRGKILNLSGGGATQPMPNISAYAGTKAAVVRLTETLAEELRAHHIDVNAVAPGALNTRLLDEVLAAGPEKVGSVYYEKAIKQRDSGGASIALAGELCVFLASAESNGITGKLISAPWDPWRKLAGLRDALEKSDIYTLRRILPEDRGQDFNS